MMSEKSGPLESGDREARYVLIDEHGEEIGPADTLHAIRERREELDAMGDLFVVREDRTVIPDSADVDHHGVVNVSRVHEALDAARAILSGEADELDARRPHRHAYLYDVADGLRYQAERTREELDKLETEPTPRTDGGVQPAPDDAADAHYALNSVSVDGEDRVRADLLPSILTLMGDRDPEDVPAYTELPEDAGKWTTAASLALAFAGREPATDPDVRMFREWVEGFDTTEPYDVKTLRVHEPERGRYVSVMVNRLDGRNHALGEMGFTGVYFQFNVMSQNADFRLTRLSAYEIKRDHPVDWFPDSNAYSLIAGLDTGSVDWTALADGDHLTPEDVEELTDDGGEDGE